MALINIWRFGYLVHLTPTDEVYKDIGFFTKIYLRDRYTDFVDTVMNYVSRYDIIQYEKSLLQFGIFATHDLSFKNTISKLLDCGIELSQIKILFKENTEPRWAATSMRAFLCGWSPADNRP